MSRMIKEYPSETRKYNIANNLQCTYCGNTTAFYTNLKLKHEITVEDGYLSVALNKKKSKRILDAISKNIWDMVDKSKMDGKEVFFCANCDESEAVDFQERLIDYCWQMNCPGCEVCGDYIPEADLREMCSQCIEERNGEITEEDCIYSCPNYDYGMIEVFNHYGLTLDDMKNL